MCVQPNEAFERIVRRGKGSYCFGQNGLFLGILRALEYRYVVTTSASSVDNIIWVEHTPCSDGC